MNSPVIIGDCRDSMRKLIADGVKVQTCVTSPPYYGLRSYIPDAVRLRDDLTDDERTYVDAELARLGILPTSEVV